jgi:predicted ester cyclase
MPTVRSAVTAFSPLFLFLVLSCAAPPEDFRESNEQVIRDIYAALDAQDFDRLNAMVAPDLALHLVGTQESVPWNAVVTEMIPMYYGALEGYHHVVDQFVAEGVWVVARVTFQGTHTGDFQGASATGNAFAYGGVHMVRIVNGVVQEFWLLEDDLGLMRQLGMDLAPTGSGS